MTETWWTIRRQPALDHGTDTFLTGDYSPTWEVFPKLPTRFESERSAETHAAGMVLLDHALFGFLSVVKIRCNKKDWYVWM